MKTDEVPGTPQSIVQRYMKVMYPGNGTGVGYVVTDEDAKHIRVANALVRNSHTASNQNHTSVTVSAALEATYLARTLSEGDALILHARNGCLETVGTYDASTGTINGDLPNGVIRIVYLGEPG